MRTWGHPDCGIYAQVMAGGDIATGDALVATGPAAAAPEPAVPDSHPPA
jgi:hypothetical protein